MEAQINITKITQTNPKFYYTLASFPQDIVGKLQIIILQQTDYDMLKDACEKFKLELWDKLMSSSVVTGPPLIYLNELMISWTNILSQIRVGDIVRHKFLQALLASMKPVLAAQIDLDTDHLLYLKQQEDVHQLQVSQIQVWTNKTKSSIFG